MKLLARFLALFALLLVGTFPFSETALGQSYPTNNPTYIPAPLIPATTLTTTGDVKYLVNGPGTIFVRFSGTFTGLIAEVDCTESRAAAPTWTGALSLQPVGAGTGRVSSVTATGLFYFSSSAFAQCRVHVTQLSTGSVVITLSGGNARFTEVADYKRVTYRAVVQAFTPVASATDFISIIGSATTTIRVKKVYCSGISTANATYPITLVKRSTADTGGTPTAATAVPLDASDAAATAVVNSYAANPTTGSLVGNVAAGSLTTNTLAASTIAPPKVEWLFGEDNEEEITLRGVAQTLAINGRGASITGGASVDCVVEWTE